MADGGEAGRRANCGREDKAALVAAKRAAIVVSEVARREHYAPADLPASADVAAAVDALRVAMEVSSRSSADHPRRVFNALAAADFDLLRGCRARVLQLLTEFVRSTETAEAACTFPFTPAAQDLLRQLFDASWPVLFPDDFRAKAKGAAPSDAVPHVSVVYIVATSMTAAQWRREARRVLHDGDDRSQQQASERVPFSYIVMLGVMERCLAGAGDGDAMVGYYIGCEGKEEHSDQRFSRCHDHGTLNGCDCVRELQWRRRSGVQSPSGPTSVSRRFLCITLPGQPAALAAELAIGSALMGIAGFGPFLGASPHGLRRRWSTSNRDCIMEDLHAARRRAWGASIRLKSLDDEPHALLRVYLKAADTLVQRRLVRLKSGAPLEMLPSGAAPWLLLWEVVRGRGETDEYVVDLFDRLCTCALKGRCAHFWSGVVHYVAARRRSPIPGYEVCMLDAAADAMLGIVPHHGADRASWFTMERGAATPAASWDDVITSVAAGVESLAVTLPAALQQVQAACAAPAGDDGAVASAASGLPTLPLARTLAQAVRSLEALAQRVAGVSAATPHGHLPLLPSAHSAGEVAAAARRQPRLRQSLAGIAGVAAAATASTRLLLSDATLPRSGTFPSGNLSRAVGAATAATSVADSGAALGGAALLRLPAGAGVHGAPFMRSSTATLKRGAAAIASSAAAISAGSAAGAATSSLGGVVPPLSTAATTASAAADAVAEPAAPPTKRRKADAAQLVQMHVPAAPVALLAAMSRRMAPVVAAGAAAAARGNAARGDGGGPCGTGRAGAARVPLQARAASSAIAASGAGVDARRPAPQRATAAAAPAAAALTALAAAVEHGRVSLTVEVARTYFSPQFWIDVLRADFPRTLTDSPCTAADRLVPPPGNARKFREQCVRCPRCGSHTDWVDLPRPAGADLPFVTCARRYIVNARAGPYVEICGVTPHAYLGGEMLGVVPTAARRHRSLAMTFPDPRWLCWCTDEGDAPAAATSADLR